jgi:hypothetical protein
MAAFVCGCSVVSSTALSIPPPAFGECVHRSLARGVPAMQQGAAVAASAASGAAA